MPSVTIPDASTAAELPAYPSVPPVGTGPLLAATRGFDAAAQPRAEAGRARGVLQGACPVVTSHGGRDPVLRTPTPATRS